MDKYEFGTEYPNVEFKTETFLDRYGNQRRRPVPTTPGPSWDPKRSQKYEKNMANKFLPFVVESSTPSSIFKTLISRSKGMNQVVLASVFNLVLTKPIGDLREYVKTLPEASLEKIYEELLVKYPDFRIPDSDVNTFLSVLSWFPDTKDYEYWSNELEQYEQKDIITFFLGMIHAGKDISGFTNIPFDKVLSSNSEFIDEALNNFKGLIRFDDSGEQIIVVGSRKDLVGFVLYKIFLEETVVPDRNPDLIHRLVWSQEDASS